LKTNKTRSALTILGIVIGISSVILMMSLGDGAQNLILGQIMSMGPNNVYVEPGAFTTGGGDMTQQMMEGMEIKTLTLKDMEAIENDPLVEMVAPMVLSVARVVYKNNDEKVTLFGTTPAYNEITNSRTALGSDFTDFDVQSMSKVAVLGYKVKEDLFEDENPIGKIIRIKQTNFRIIGVMEEQGTQMFQNLDEYIYIPITTVQKFLLGINHVQSSVIEIVEQDKIDEAVEGIRLMLRERHNIYNPEGDLSKDDFKVVSGKETADLMNTVTSILSLLLSSVAAIALVVGGIGIMNIMLVSVVERTREIGLRKAVGARKKDILYQFLIEAMVLTGLGGILGILLGAILSYLVSVVLTMALGIEWEFVLSLSSIIIAFGVATGIGLVFGIYPARKAAKLSPIDALRYE
ncbi:MAG TPA: ABC transporter permease, partial [Candidatus Paceibacterota bacterium]|nr:ABC transporter permease [Candidatus Paceibacterota bacterium]